MPFEETNKERLQAIQRLKDKNYPDDEIEKITLATPDTQSLVFMTKIMSPFEKGQYEITGAP